jgi:hypothetical protein
VLAVEYDLPAHAGAARIWARVTRPPRPILTPGAYVAACRRLAGDRVYTDVVLDGDPPWRPLVGYSRVDGRLVAAGFGLCPPRRWVESELDRFLRFWRRTAGRPGLVGSSYNPHSPEVTYQALRAGVPAWIVASGVRLTGRDGRVHRVTRSRRRRLQAMARAMRRRSFHRYGVTWGHDALRAIGRLSPELQAVAVLSVRREQAARKFAAWTVRARDLDWPRIAAVQAEILANPTGPLRAAWSAVADAKTPLGVRATAMLPAWCRAEDGTVKTRQAIEWFAPGSRCVSLARAVRLARGETPAEIAGGLLSEADAARWIASELDPAEWLAAEIASGLPSVRDRERVLDERGPRLLAWLRAVDLAGGLPALSAERVLSNPQGERFRVRYLEQLSTFEQALYVDSTERNPDVLFARAFDWGSWQARNLRPVESPAQEVMELRARVQIAREAVAQLLDDLRAGRARSRDLDAARRALDALDNAAPGDVVLVRVTPPARPGSEPPRRKIVLRETD